MRIWSLAAIVFIGLASCSDRTMESAKTTITEAEFASDHSLRLTMDQVGIVFLEPKNSQSAGKIDTGDLGTDIIPLVVLKEQIITYTLDPADTTIEKINLLSLPGNKAIMEVTRGNPGKSAILKPGAYDLVITSGYTVAEAKGASHRTVFLHKGLQASTAGALGLSAALSNIDFSGVRSGKTAIPISNAANNCGFDGWKGCADLFTGSNAYRCIDLCPDHCDANWNCLVPFNCFCGLANVINACAAIFNDQDNLSRCEDACQGRVDWGNGLSPSDASLCANEFLSSYNIVVAACGNTFTDPTHIILCIHDCRGSADAPSADLCAQKITYLINACGIFTGADHYQSCLSQCLGSADVPSAQHCASLVAEEINLMASSSCPSCNLNGVSLSNANLPGANLSGASLNGANLTGANLAGANLNNADLSNATLTGADFTGATLVGANLNNTYLTGTNFTNANLTNVYLGPLSWDCTTKFTGADLSGLNLEGFVCPNGSVGDCEWINSCNF